MRMLVVAILGALAFPALSADRIPIANEGTTADRWAPVPGTLYTPAYPDQYASEPEEVCLVVGYLINADGHTSDFALLKSWSSGSNSRGRTEFWETFAGAASQVMAYWQFAPKPGAQAAPVYTASTFVFGRPENSAATQARCAVSDLTQRLVELRYDGRAGRLMGRGIYGRLDIDPEVEERFRQQAVMAREEANRSMMANREAQPQKQSTPPPSSGGN